MNPSYCMHCKKETSNKDEKIINSNNRSKLSSKCCDCSSSNGNIQLLRAQLNLLDIYTQKILNKQ